MVGGKNKFHKVKIRGLLGVVTLLGCLGFSACKESKNKPTVLPPVKVEVKVIGGAVGEKTEEFSTPYSATVDASETTTLSFSVAGTIESLNVKEGDKVIKGEVLGQLKRGDYENARNIAQAQLAEAQDGYNRLKKLHDANALPQVKWVEMEQKLKQAENAAEMADRTLSDATLRSPVAGTVSRKFAEPGQSVLPVQPIYEIVSTNKLCVEVSLSENEIGKISTGQKALITFEVEGVSPIEAKVSSKSVVADPLSRSYTVKIDLPAGEEKILPGMLANVRFENAGTEVTGTEEIILPSGTVILNDDNRWFVWLVKNGEAERKFVEVDQLVSNGLLVKSGLMRGDSVIVAGMQKVGTGTKVTVK